MTVRHTHPSEEALREAVEVLQRPFLFGSRAKLRDHEVARQNRIVLVGL